jgi:RteC protein
LNTAHTLLNELNEKLDTQNFKDISYIKIVENSVFICEEYHFKLKEFIKSNTFQSNQEEIDFFKTIKPKFTSKLYYFISVFNLELQRPSTSQEIQKIYLQEQLGKIKTFKDANTETYKYFKSNATFLDEKCFLRNKRDLRFFLDPIVYQFDANFSTSHDHKIAMILAYDELELYILKELDKLEENYKDKENLKVFHLQWTEKKVSLVELIYSLYAAGVINNGKTEIAELAKFFEQYFNIDLGDYYRKYLEIRSRKVNPTKFIDSIKAALLKKMEEDLQ